ncbi:syntaxin-52-like [Senna tora]|uniref:Syntaxin-52-like n=1 Tax=Senna tora TaxID=362788 RepID=A0A834TKG4_9FABA|nr:syntaxin-52-like [Senna tora]
MASDPWVRQFNEASKLAEEVKGMISAKSSQPSSGPETPRHLSAARRKITILRTKIEILQSLISTLPSQQPITGKEINRRQDQLANLSSKANQMATTLNMSGLANRDSLLGPDKKSEEVMNKAAGLDNQGLVGFQRQIIKEQDSDLEKLEETVISTKHIALAVNEELTLHTRLLDDLDEQVDTTNSRLQGGNVPFIETIYSSIYFRLKYSREEDVQKRTLRRTIISVPSFSLTAGFSLS